MAMKNRISEAFDKIHSDEALKESTKAYVAQKTEEYERQGKGAVRPALRSPIRRFAPALLCLLIILGIGGGGSWLYFVPTATISIDINPSLELGVNRFDKIVSVDGYNSDGKELADSCDVMYMNYNEAVKQILSNQTIVSLLSDNGELEIVVAGASEKQCARMLSDMESCTAEHENAHCYSVEKGEADCAHEMGLSYGRYQAYLKLKEQIPDIMPEDVQNMSMKEIRDLLADGTSDNVIDDEVTHHHGEENGHRHGR